MAPKKLYRQDLLNASEHLCYEIWMLHHMGRALAYGLAGEGPIHNAFIESFAIHVRNLTDFLYEKKPVKKPDAILARDYFLVPEEWTSICPTQSSILKEAKIRCCKQVAHLTITRRKKKTWDFIKIVKALHEPLTIFINNIDITLLGEHFIPIKHYFK